MEQANSIGIYLRISSDREGRELGVVRQEEDCRGVAGRLKGRVYRIYKDNDLGASTRSRKPRPEYKALLADAKAGAINTIVAYTTSRLTRRPREHEDLLELAETVGTQFHYVASPSFDLNTSAGRMVARMLAANDAAEAEYIAERVSRAKKAGAEKGKYLGGYRGWCYEGAQYDQQGQLTNRGRINMAVVDAEVAIYKECVRRVIAGEAAIGIMRDLNRRGIPSPSGKQWAVGNFKRTLSKQRYVIFDDADPEQRGTLVYKGNEHQAAWPGLITRAEYELMMARFQEAAQPWTHGMAKGRSYLLSGLAVCGRCGSACYGSGRALDNGTYQRRYRCRGRDNHGNIVGCGRVFRGAEPLDAYVTEAVLGKLDAPEIAKALGKSKDNEADINRLVVELENHRRRRKEILTRSGRGEFNLADTKMMIQAVDESIEASQDELSKYRDDRAAHLLPEHGLIRDIWPTQTLDWQSAVLKLLVDRVKILPAGAPGSKLWNGHRFDTEAVQIVWRELSHAEMVPRLSVLLKSALTLAA